MTTGVPSPLALLPHGAASYPAGRRKITTNGWKGRVVKDPNMTWSRMQAVIDKREGEEGVVPFLRGELSVSEPNRRWREQDGVIYLSVTSGSTTGPEWIKRLESKGFQLSKWAKDLLNSSDFKPTNGVTYE